MKLTRLSSPRTDFLFLMIENQSVEHNKVLSNRLGNYFIFQTKGRQHQAPPSTSFGGCPLSAQPSKPYHATGFQVSPYLAAKKKMPIVQIVLRVELKLEEC